MLILVGLDGPFADRSGKRPFPLPTPHKTGSFVIGVSQQTAGNPAEGQGSRSVASAAPLKASSSTAVAGSPPLASCWLRSSCKSVGVGEKLHTMGGRMGKMITGSGCILPIPVPNLLLTGPSPLKYPWEGNSWEVSKLEGMNCAFRSRCYCSRRCKDVANQALCWSPHCSLPGAPYRITVRCVLMVSSPNGCLTLRCLVLWCL